MTSLQKPLKGFARIQYKYYLVILIIFLIFTVIAGFYAKDIEFQGDFSEEMPQQLPIYQLNDKISNKFSGQDVMFVLIELDDSLNKRTVDDIRNPEVMNFIIELHNNLEMESMVDSVNSLGPAMENVKSKTGGLTQRSIKDTLSEREELSNLVNDQNTMSILMVNADVGQGQEKILEMIDLMENNVDALSKPSGTEVSITGTPSIISTTLDLLKHDSVYTLILASIIILVLLFLMERSISKAFLIFIPILFGITWTIGTMSFFNVKISVVTAGLGAMILGLGVEYGVFILTKYKEERYKGSNQKNSLFNSVPLVGSAILGSGTTTIVGFLALTFSIMPMMQHLGASLALGIFYSIIAAVVVEPILIMIEERFEIWYAKRSYKKHTYILKKK